ncbi:NUDIX domain-containing protein [Clostridium butyricum]|uniref:NUDIX hydrolase n=1 Tax=Clostridium butyricum TaxID=1492 RepID=UPI00136D01EA|nr:8-oxo-dGTP diphosphatase [Clostridium butyricum]MZI82732.1 NUDIX domain-containing protein [Clostridium butyricum]
MYKYTLCFIIQNDKILLLNREKSRWMGSWNGVGGKFEENETPTQCILREVLEETGIKLHKVKYRGIIKHIIDDFKKMEIYVFIAELPYDYIYNTPKKSNEGILDWKRISWILNPENTGIPTDIPQVLPLILESDDIHEHLCVFQNNFLVEYKSSKIKL